MAFTAKSQSELHFDPARVAKLVAATPADAWVVATAPPEVLGLFAAQPALVIAVGGGRTELPMASVYVDLVPGRQPVALPGRYGIIAVSLLPICYPSQVQIR